MHQNTGLIIKPPPLKGYVAGLVTGITYKINLPSGNWRPYRSSGERQFSIQDFMSCVSMSCNNGIEDNINFQKPTLTDEFLLTLLTPPELVLFKDFFGADGLANLSDRVLAQRSGTTTDGNDFWTVISVAREVAVPESVWPLGSSMYWNDYYAPCPQEIVDKYSEVFFKVFKVTHEFISPDIASLSYHLKQAPVQIATGVCPGWQTVDPVKYCGRHSEHATILEHLETDIKCIGDSYEPYQKRLASDYYLDAAMKILLTINTPQTMIVRENHLYQLVEAPGGFALGLNGKLVIDDLAKILASFTVRNNGNTDGKTVSIKLADWNSVQHQNLKGEIII